MVGRRILLLGVSLSMCGASLAKERVASVRRIGLLGSVPSDPRDPAYVALLSELRRWGYVEGKNLLLMERSDDEHGALDAMARELTAVPVDVIVAADNFATAAARRATKTIPIVMISSGDPVGSGFVSSLAQPGGNVTGTAFFAPELKLKQLDILIEGLGAPKRLGYVIHKDHRLVPRFMARVKELQSAASSRRIELREVYVDSSSLAETLERLVHERVEGVVVEDYAAGEVSESELAALAVKMPLIMTSPYAARAGVLFTYGVNMVDLTRKSAEYVARLLGGARPSDLPVQLPTKFEFVINLKTAESLGLQIPRALLLRADQLVR